MMEINKSNIKKLVDRCKVKLYAKEVDNIRRIINKIYDTYAKTKGMDDEYCTNSQNTFRLSSFFNRDIFDTEDDLINFFQKVYNETKHIKNRPIIDISLITILGPSLFKKIEKLFYKYLDDDDIYVPFYNNIKIMETDEDLPTLIKIIKKYGCEYFKMIPINLCTPCSKILNYLLINYPENDKFGVNLSLMTDIGELTSYIEYYSSRGKDIYNKYCSAIRFKKVDDGALVNILERLMIVNPPTEENIGCILTTLIRDNKFDNYCKLSILNVFITNGIELSKIKIDNDNMKIYEFESTLLKYGASYVQLIILLAGDKSEIGCKKKPSKEKYYFNYVTKKYSFIGNILDEIVSEYSSYSNLVFKKNNFGASTIAIVPKIILVIKYIDTVIEYFNLGCDDNYNTTKSDNNHNSTKSDNNHNSTKSDNNRNSTKSDNNRNSTKSDGDYSSTESDDDCNSTKSDGHYTNAISYGDYYSTESDGYYNSTESDDDYNSTESDDDYNSTESDDEYDSTEFDDNYCIPIHIKKIDCEKIIEAFVNISTKWNHTSGIPSVNKIIEIFVDFYSNYNGSGKEENELKKTLIDNDKINFDISVYNVVAKSDNDIGIVEAVYSKYGLLGLNTIKYIFESPCDSLVTYLATLGVKNNNFMINYPVIDKDDINVIYKYYGDSIFSNIDENNITEIIIKKIIEGTNYDDNIIVSLFYKIIDRRKDKEVENKIEYLVKSGLDLHNVLEGYIKKNIEYKNIFFDKLLSNNFDPFTLLKIISSWQSNNITLI